MCVSKLAAINMLGTLLVELIMKVVLLATKDFFGSNARHTIEGSEFGYFLLNDDLFSTL